MSIIFDTKQLKQVQNKAACEYMSRFSYYFIRLFCKHGHIKQIYPSYKLFNYGQIKSFLVTRGIRKLSVIKILTFQELTHYHYLFCNSAWNRLQGHTGFWKPCSNNVSNSKLLDYLKPYACQLLLTVSIISPNNDLINNLWTD